VVNCVWTIKLIDHIKLIRNDTESMINKPLRSKISIEWPNYESLLVFNILDFFMRTG
jgi:hypothetical protein